MKLPFLFLSALVSNLAFSQTTITPGNGAFEKKWIKPGTTEMTCYTNSNGQWLPFASFDISITESNSRLSVHTKLKMLNSPDLWLDTSVSEISTLKPVYRSSVTPSRKMTLHFGNEVNGHYYDNATRKQTIIKDNPGNSYFESYTYPYLLAALPLSSGYRAELPVYDYKPDQKGHVKKASIEEVKSNTYMSELTGEHKVWQVTVMEEATNDRYDYYIDKDNRRLWKIEVNSKGQKILMVDKENDYNPFTTKFDKQQTMAMLKSGKSVITGQAFARDNENEGLLKGMAVLNVNKKQYAAKGVAVVLIPYTDYFKEWIKLNQASRKKGRSIPLSKEAAECIKVSTIHDQEGHFEFVNLQPGDYMLYTEFGYTHTSTRTEVIGYTDTYINGIFQGSSANTETYKVSGNAAAAVQKIITIKTNGEKVNVKLKKTL